ncbi:MAG: YARHG domain-containing protein [Chitinophagales bacterium]
MKNTKITLPSLLIFLLLFSCKTENNVEETKDVIVEDEIATIIEDEEPKEEIENPNNMDPDDFIGHWVGWFEAEEYKENTDYSYSNFINISIEEIKGDSVFGRSIVAGNDRPFAGTISVGHYNYAFDVAEPGDDKYDGEFSFHFEEGKLIGIWQSYDEELLVTKRSYELEKREFVYNPENNLEEGEFYFTDLGRYKEIVDEYDGELYYDQAIATVTEKIYEFNPSLELIPEEEIANMHKGDLQVLRNSIYAKHGYSFKNRIYRHIFEKSYLDWYIPVSTDVRDELTDIEIQNIELIKRYEEYAEDYYDVFGR